MTDDPIPERVARLEQRTEDDHQQLKSLGPVVVQHAQLSTRLDGIQSGLNDERRAREELRANFDEHVENTAKAEKEAKRFKLNAYIAVGALAFAAMGSIVALIALLHG